MSYFIKLFFYFTFMSSSIVHASDTKAGLPQLDLSTYPSLMFWAVISLIIGYFLMSLLVAPSIKSILNLRETNIQNDLVKAKASTQENEKIKQEIIDHQQDIKLRSQKLINEALSDSKLSIEKTENDITKKINSKISKADKNIQELQKDIISDIVNSADEIIIEIVKKFTNINHDKANLKQVVKAASKNILTEK
ncbi:preprotein translocase subunit TatA [Alphaproteobacteria bacterium]|nr:preprotein translocase subunit TatA [Alphaproteobacteria bacterium]MDC3273493.1 preprotein translocase subunit TatA [Alphaproteobacteria bacterium]